MPGAGCGTYRCCYDTPDDIPACWHWHEIVGFTYDDGMDPVHHPECWVGITRDGTQSDQTGCRTCEHGCHGFEDDLGNLFLSALWVDGKSYLRSEINARFGRDAKNRIFDLKTNTPTLIQRRCRLEHGSCYENDPEGHCPAGSCYGGYVCWGHHVCQCTPEPDWIDPCPTALDVGYPVGGLTPDIFFFNYRGWPPSGGVLGASELFCRKWHPANGGSPRNAPFNVYGENRGPIHNAGFLRSREGLNVDALVPCAGFIAPSECSNPTDGDCTYGFSLPPHNGTRPESGSAYINQTQPSSQGKFEELWIDLPTVDIRMREFPLLSARQLREHQLYHDIFAEAIGREYPHPDGGLLNMDRVAMDYPSNDFLGYYTRTFTGSDWEESDLPRIMEFPYCYTKWGRVPITAYMVITYCRMVVQLTVPHFARAPLPGSGDPADHWIKPFATVTIHVNVAMLCDPVSTPIKVGGVPVVVTNPTWGDQGYDGIPTATPEGNEIIYAREVNARGRPLPVRTPRKWRWFGRLGSFSDPATIADNAERNPQWQDFNPVGIKCGDRDDPEHSLIDIIGTFTVPALATANESHPEDPNRNWAGSMSFFFSHEA